MYFTSGKVYSGDTFFHLLISEHIREHNWKYPSSIENVTFMEGEKRYNYLAYPPLLHYITAVFPVNFHLKVTKIFNLIVLSILSSLTAITVYDLTANLTVAIFASFIVIFNLSVFELATMWTPRPLGLLFYSLIVLGAIFSPQSLFSIIAITVLVILVILTHKFALQVLVFGLLPYAILFDKPYLLLAFALGFSLSILVSRGAYIEIFKEHISWLYFYSRHPSRERITRKLTRIVTKNFWSLAIIALIVILLLQNNLDLLHTGLVSRIIYWAFIPIVIALFVSIPSLSFLGEEYRYIEYGVVPVGIAVSLLLTNSNIYPWLVLLISLVCILMCSIALFKYKEYLCNSKVLVNPDDISSYSSLATYRLSNLLIFPHTRTLEVRYFTKLHVVHQVRKASGFKSDSEYLDDLLSKCNVQYVLKFKGIDPFKLFALLSNTMNMKKIATFTNFELYELLSKKPK
jgi:hypothetical protein